MNSRSQEFPTKQQKTTIVFRFDPLTCNSTAARSYEYCIVTFFTQDVLPAGIITRTFSPRNALWGEKGNGQRCEALQSRPAFGSNR